MESERCLLGELVRNKGKTVFVGVRSSFFYIGPSEEAINELNLIGLMAKYGAALMSDKDVSRQIASSSGLEIGGRKVLRTYDRGYDPNADEVVIIVEGREFGVFWTRDEYLSGRQMLIDALGKPKAG